MKTRNKTAAALIVPLLLFAGCFHNTSIAALDGGPPDGDPDAELCAPLCDEPIAARNACNPVCQKGCACNQRCNLLGETAQCVAMGDRQLGQLCNLSQDNCAAGLTCLQEACGQVGRCYRFCSSDGQCDPASGAKCRIPILAGGGRATGLKVCDLARQACDPRAQTGCPLPFSCYLQPAGQTVCDCPSFSQGVPGAGREGAGCQFYNDCAAGLACAAVPSSDGQSLLSCRPICAADQPSCLGAASCRPLGPNFGICDPASAPDASAER